MKLRMQKQSWRDITTILYDLSLKVAAVTGTSYFRSGVINELF
jgi:hypothetical protein